MKRFAAVMGWGFLVWLVPFVAAVALQPVKEKNRLLFESIMPVVVCIAATAAAYFHLRGRANVMRAAIVAGVVWLVISIVIDLMMFSGGPKKMGIGEYFGDIGVAYLIVPVVCLGMGMMGRSDKAGQSV
jgi:hypothetical protein